MAKEATEKPNSTYGILTGEGIARLRQRVGVQYNKPTLPHNYEVSIDGLRHFANGYGDGNPLWCEPEYGKSTRWGGPIAPPSFLYTMGEQDAAQLTPENKALLKGDPLVGLGSYQAEMSFEWWRPQRLGDRLKRRSALVGVDGGAALVVEPTGEHWPLAAGARRRLAEELGALAAADPVTAAIRRFYFHPSFPVDARHNAKIFRDKLSVWAATQTAVDLAPPSAGSAGIA